MSSYYILLILYQASDFDDDAMFRLDDMLSAAFKSLRKGKRLDKEKELKLKHYKMRFIAVFSQHEFQLLYALYIWNSLSKFYITKTF